MSLDSKILAGPREALNLQRSVLKFHRFPSPAEVELKGAKLMEQATHGRMGAWAHAASGFALRNEHGHISRACTVSGISVVPLLLEARRKGRFESKT